MKIVSPDYDCIIVGAGLVGMAQAIALQREGLHVALIDTRKPAHDTSVSDPRGLALSPSSQAFLNVLGLWEDLEGVIQPIRHIHVSDQGHFGVTRMNARDVGLDALAYVCPVNHLLGSLQRGVTNVDILWQTGVEDISDSHNASILRVREGKKVRDISARLIIGADGINSKVRESLGIKTRVYDYEQTAIVANVTLQYGDGDTAYERFTRSGPLALLPLSHTRHVVVRCCRSDQCVDVLEQSDDEFVASLEAGFGYRFGAMKKLSKRSAHVLSLIQARQIIGRRSALVGAAAMAIHPNGAQGLNLGLRDVSQLAHLVGVKFAAEQDIGADECLAQYAGARSTDHRAIVRFTDSLARVFSTSLTPVAVLRNLAMLGLDITPAAKNWLVHRATGALAQTMLH